MTIPYWSIPAILSILAWLLAIGITKSIPKSSGYDFGRSLMGLFYGALAVIVTLVVWLIFFINF